MTKLYYYIYSYKVIALERKVEMILKKRYYKYLLLVTFFFLAPYSWALEIMPLKDVKPGMKGIAKTVFYQNKVESFQVEVLSIVENSEPQQNMILARFTGKQVQKFGIAEGMSGSPVYINGKLVGAIAYTWGNLKESIGGIQPIEQMLPVLKENNKPIDLSPKDKLKVSPALNPFHNIHPISVPLIVNGFSKEGFNLVSKSVINKGFSPIATGGASSFKNTKQTNKKLVAGDAVGILLMSGDAQASAIGTVTYVDERDPRKVLIFGHPFQSLGYVDFLMTKATVHYTMPSTNIPWKFATASDIVGTIYNDRQTGVAGKMGVFSQLVPVSVSVSNENEKTAQIKNFHYNITPDGNFFPNLFAGSLVSSFSRYNGGKTQTVSFHVKMQIENLSTHKLDTVNLNNTFLGEEKDIIQNMAQSVIKPLEALYFNIYNNIKIKKVTAQIKYVDQVRVAQIVKVMGADFKVAPGEKAKIQVVLNTFQNKKEVVYIDIPIPYGYKESAFPLIISGGIMANANYDKNYLGIDEPKNYEQLLLYLDKKDQSQSIVAYYDEQGITANVDGFVLKDLPLSKAYNYGIKMQGNKYFSAVRTQYLFPTNYIVLGEISVLIPIKN
jgi:hypothetical protein